MFTNLEYMPKVTLALLTAILSAIALIGIARYALPSDAPPPQKIVERIATPEMVAMNETVTYLSQSTSNRGTTIFAAPLQVVLSTPSWNGFPDDPPLSAPEAVRIARRWQKEQGRYAPNIHAINLQEKPQTSKKWAYTIYFDPNTDQKMTKGREQSFVIVLFDGSVVGPAGKQE